MIEQFSCTDLEIVQEKQKIIIKYSDINKGLLSQLLLQYRAIQTEKIDFIAVFGYNESDEDIFNAIKKSRLKFNQFLASDAKIYLVSTEIKQTEADYYVLDKKRMSNIIDGMIDAESFVESRKSSTA